MAQKSKHTTMRELHEEIFEEKRHGFCATHGFSPLLSETELLLIAHGEEGTIPRKMQDETIETVMLEYDINQKGKGKCVKLHLFFVIEHREEFEEEVKAESATDSVKAELVAATMDPTREFQFTTVEEAVEQVHTAMDQEAERTADFDLGDLQDERRRSSRQHRIPARFTDAT